MGFWRLDYVLNQFLNQTCFKSVFIFYIFSSVSDPDKRLQALWVVCDKLPKNCKTNLRFVMSQKQFFSFLCPTGQLFHLCSFTLTFSCRYLVKFLSKLAQDSEVNKMTPSNIAIVLGPNLLWAKTEGWEQIDRKERMTLLKQHYMLLFKTRKM